MFKVEYKYSACIKIITNDIVILCDPWFITPANEGTWGHYPPVKEIKNLVGDFDVIYLSHIHSDHYCPDTIKYLFDHYGKKRILIADWGHANNYLLRKLQADGLSDDAICCSTFDIGKTGVVLIPNKTSSGSDIDSSIIVYSKTTRKSVLNINDCYFNEGLSQAILSTVEELGLTISLFCLGYTGAGPYPQSYYSPFIEVDTLIEKANRKKEDFFERYLYAVNSISSTNRLPFAGKYVLQGELSLLNKFRGVADALEVKKIDPGAIILDDGGHAYYDIELEKAFFERKTSYCIPPYIPPKSEFPWRTAINFIPQDSLLLRLLSSSLKRAHSKSECSRNCLWSIYVLDNPSDILGIWMSQEPWTSLTPLKTFNCNNKVDHGMVDIPPDIHSHMFIERKALFCALTGISHWNNYAGGSVYQVRRVPDEFDRSMQNYLNFLCVV